MMKPLRVDEERAEQLNRVVAVGPDVLKKIVDELQAVTQTMSHSELLRVFTSAAAPDVAEVVLNNVAGLSLLRDDGPNDAEAVVDALIEGCRAEHLDSLANSLHEIRGQLLRLVSDPSIYKAIKSAKLFAADGLHLHDFKVHCDIRPLFEPDRSKINSVLVYGVLNIVASGRDEVEQSLRVSLRSSDLDRIVKECERAKDKIEVIGRSLGEPKSFEVVIYGTR